MRYENVVIGSSLEAVYYSYMNDCHLIINSLRRPFEFDPLEVDSSFGLDGLETKLEAWSQIVLEQSIMMRMSLFQTKSYKSVLTNIEF